MFSISVRTLSRLVRNRPRAHSAAIGRLLVLVPHRRPSSCRTQKYATTPAITSAGGPSAVAALRSNKERSGWSTWTGAHRGARTRPRGRLHRRAARAVARRALERRPAGARTAQHARLHVVRRAPRSRAALAASPAAPHRLAPPCVARRVTHLARPAACGTSRARSVSVRGGKGGHSHTYQEHAHCARARALDAVGRACSCRMRLEGILRVPKSL